MLLIIGGAFQGKTEFAKSTFNVKDNEIYNNFHLKILDCIQQNKSVSDVIAQAEKYKVVISDEIGCGIVPMDKVQRRWREETGRALCEIAKNSSQVWRVYCGVGTKIKG